MQNETASSRTIDLRKRSRPLWYLFGSIVSLAALGYLIYFFEPTANYTLYNIQITILPLFFFLLFFFFFSTGTYILNSKTHGILIALLVITYLLFRLNNLTHPFFAVLLLALFLVLELLFTYRK